jgi:hypothetical protein
VELSINGLEIQSNNFFNFSGEFSVFGNLKKGIFEIRMIGIFLLKKDRILEKNDLQISYRKKSLIYRFFLYILFLIFFKSKSISENIKFFKISGDSTAFLAKKNVFSIGKSVIMRIYLRGSDDKYIINIILLFYTPARRICK